jgi:hypothetical protein
VFTHVSGDVSLLDDLLFVALPGSPPPNTEFPAARRELRLPAPWDDVTKLTERFNGTVFERNGEGAFVGVEPGVYNLDRSSR